MGNHARFAYTAGFGPILIPVTPPGAPHDPGIDASDMGKCPGVLRGDRWVPVGVPTFPPPSYEEVKFWDDWGANVGFALGRGTGLFAIDCDADDPVAASAVHAVLCRRFPALLWRTVPGRYRCLYPLRCPEPVRTSQMKFRSATGEFKIDILGEGRQFVAAGTHVSGRPYEWSDRVFDAEDGWLQFPIVEGAALRDLVDEIVAELEGIGWERVAGARNVVTTGTAGNVTPRTPEVATEHELGRWLALTPNGENDPQFEDRNDWVAMAHAIWGATSGSPRGKEIWLAWCDQRSQEPGSAERVWDTIRPGSVHAGIDWIRTKARERSPRMAAQLDFELAPPVDPQLLEQIAAGAATGAIWPHILPRYVWVSAKAMFHDLVTGVSHSKTGLDMAMGKLVRTLRNECQALFPGGGWKTFSQLFSAHPDCVVADDFTYHPGQPRLTQGPNGQVLVNLWREHRFRHVPNVTENDIRPWLDHMGFVFGKDAYRRMLRYFALVVRYPGIKPNYAPLVMTAPGLGKDTALLPVIYAVGPNNAREVTPDQLANQWTDFLEVRLIYVSETRQHARGAKSSHDVMNDLKSFLADKPEMVGVNKKGQGVYQVPNLSAWVFFSNEARPVYLAEGDRRIWVIDNMTVKPKDPAYYENLNAWLSANKQKIASFLRDYALTAKEIAEFKGRAPDTAAKYELIASNRDPVVAALADIIEEAKAGALFPSLVVRMEDVEGELRHRVRIAPSRGILSSHLRSLGARPVAADNRGGAALVRLSSQTGQNSVVRLWVLGDRDEKGRDYSTIQPRDAAHAYLDGKWPGAVPGERTTSTGAKLRVADNSDIV